MTITNIIEAKNAKITELRNAIVTTEDAEQRKALNDTLTAVEAEIAELRKAEAEMNAPAPAAKQPTGLNVVATQNTTGADDAEARANAFAKSGTKSIETRSVLVSSGKIATPTQVAGINDAQNVVSSIVDLVKVTDAEGMGAYKVAYVSAIGAAGEQTEGGAYTAGEPTFGFVEIKPTTQSILSYVSRQVQKQSPLNYEGKVSEAARAALRKAAAKIVTDAIVASNLNDTVTLPAIDEKALRTIAFTYGGDENVDGQAYLFLNKTDLIKFGDVRGSNKTAVYEITPDAANPNTGVIRDGGLAVKCCIDSHLAAGTILYGQPMNCELALFSNYDVRVSEDFAFDKGLLAVRGDVELGADVVADGGFVKATVSAG